MASWLSTNDYSRLLLDSILANKNDVVTITDDIKRSSLDSYKMFFNIGLGTEMPLQNKFFTQKKYKMVQAGTPGNCDLSQKVDVLIHSYGKKFDTQYKYGNPYYLYSATQSLKVIEQVESCLIKKYPKKRQNITNLVSSSKQQYSSYIKVQAHQSSKIKKIITFTEDFDYLLQDLGIEPLYVPPTMLQSKHALEQTNLLAYIKSAYALIPKGQASLKQKIAKLKHFQEFQIIEIDPSVKQKSHLQFLKDLASPLIICRAN